MTYSEQHAEDNGAALKSAVSGLTAEQLGILCAHLLGGLSPHVDPADFGRALRCSVEHAAKYAR